MRNLYEYLMAVVLVIAAIVYGAGELRAALTGLATGTAQRVARVREQP